MLTERDVLESRRREESTAQSFLKAVIGFIKWTASLTTAAILWVGFAMGANSGPSRHWMIASLVILIGSLILSILNVGGILTIWAKEWNVAQEDERLVLMKELKALRPDQLTQQQEEEQVKRLVKAIDATKAFNEPAGFQRWVLVHIILLVTGLLFYLIGQV